VLSREGVAYRRGAPTQTENTPMTDKLILAASIALMAIVLAAINATHR
jgi:hypothetical protein